MFEVMIQNKPLPDGRVPLTLVALVQGDYRRAAVARLLDGALGGAVTVVSAKGGCPAIAGRIVICAPSLTQGDIRALRAILEGAPSWGVWGDRLEDIEAKAALAAALA